MASKGVDRASGGTALVERVPCNLCGSNDSDVVFTKDAFNIVKCRTCGLTYVNPRLSPLALVKEYEDEYFFAGSYDDYLGERRGFERTFERRLEKIERFVEPGKILDVGCAFGFFLSVARNRGWDAYGVDLSALSCRFAREELGAQVIRGTLRQAGFPDACFDAVVMNDAFEHLSDPYAELLEVYRVLRRGGYLFIVTQDINSLIVRLLGFRWAQYKPREHLYYFTRDTLRSILQKSNFSVVRIESEGLVCTVKFLVAKLQNVNRTTGMLAGFLSRKLRLQDVLIPVRPGYEVMVYARKE